ncbi:MAG TPA: MOSC domain-containing protein [Blastocatellia bacterium]|nr:MOSC domain-containing protein [Blastocatellia bacterium]
MIKLISVNVGLPREIFWKNSVITTGIFKEPVSRRVAARTNNLDGDRQADLKVHGGPEKAIYAYPSEHYDFWRSELPGVDLPWGMFGENLTTEGLIEDGVNVGDRFRIGTSALMVTQPRMPCFKLAAKFNRDDIIKRFLDSGRSGFYLSVIEEGEVGAGDEIERIHRDENDITIADVVKIYVSGAEDPDWLLRASRHAALAKGWRKYFQKQLETHVL